MLETLFASLAAKVAAGGLAVAMASTGAVAATGNLPDQIQTTVSEAVDNIGINIPLGETEALVQEDSTDVEGDEGEDAGESNENSDFGRSVSEDAQDGGVDGEKVSQDARDMAEERKQAGQSHRPEGTPEGADVAGDQVNDTPAAEYAPEVPAGPGTADQYKPEGVGRP